MHRRQLSALTGLALGWARLWGAHVQRDPGTGLWVCTGMRGGYARGGTTLGRVFLTGGERGRLPRPQLLRHEAVHTRQWERHGLGLAVRYLAEERRHPGRRNRFEVEAGLDDGGY